jgi:hypothetical protein
VKGLVPVDNDRRGRPREHPQLPGETLWVMTSLPGGATGSHVTGSDVSDVTRRGPGRTRKYVLRMPGVFPRFFLTKVVVQNVRMIDRTTGSAPKGIPLCVRMHTAE